MREQSLVDVRESAMRLLARREHSRTELLRKLQQRGFEKEIINQVLGELERERLLSDQRYAEALLNSRVGRGQGPLKIRQELVQNGVSDSLIEEAFSLADVDWVALAGEVRRKRFKESPPSDYPGKARQARFLANRGFASETIWRVLEDDDHAA